MSKILEYAKPLLPILRSGDLEQCERLISEKLAGLPRSPFHIVLDLSIETDPEAVGEWLDNFIRIQTERFTIKAVYVEMNGFCVNPDLWFFCAFAYEHYGGHDDYYYWLSNWQSEDSGGAAIEGLEALQAVYASEAFRDKRFSDASDLTDLLVVVKFQDLIRRSSVYMQELHFPLLASAHEYDFVYEIRPET
jgi:hypothetical protein